LTPRKRFRIRAQHRQRVQGETSIPQGSGAKMSGRKRRTGKTSVPGGYQGR